jgi:peptidoglycan/LPS O-acetylase OafA/YrhL
VLINSPVHRSPLQHIQYLDGWRGLAIALVLEGHFLGALPIDAGRFGVDVFLCCQGFSWPACCSCSASLCRCSTNAA